MAGVVAPVGDATALVERVRDRLAGGTSSLTATSVADAVRAEAHGVVSDVDVLHAVRVLERELVGAGPLEPLLAAPDTTDVLVTGPDQVWVDGADGLRRTDVRFGCEDSVRRLAQRLAVSVGRRLDDAQPYVDGWMPPTARRGSVRLHAVLPPIAADGTCVSLRVLRPAAHDLAALRRLGTFDRSVERLLVAVVRARLAFLVSGSTGSGKSTLLGALLGSVPACERIVSVEDAGELCPNHPQFVRLVARARNIEGAGEVTLHELVRQALRMRPDRLVVGEARGSEICELLGALNTGHEGGAGTVHANSPSELPARIEALAALGGMPRAALHSQLAAAVRVVLHMRRAADGTRVLAEIGVLSRSGDEVVVVPAWRDGEWACGRAALEEILRARGAPW